MKAFWSILAAASVLVLWLGPLPQLARGAFWAHMTLHIGIVAIAAPALAFAVAGTALDPVQRWPGLFPPIPLSILELVIVWAWHAPGLHHAARDGWVAFVAEQGLFLAAGLAVWLSAIGGGPVRALERAGAGIAALLLTSMHMTLLGALLALSPRSLYHKDVELCGLMPLDDQHLGGAIMLVVGGISYLAGGLWLAVGFVRRPGATQGTMS